MSESSSPPMSPASPFDAEQRFAEAAAAWNEMQDPSLSINQPEDTIDQGYISSSEDSAEADARFERLMNQIQNPDPDFAQAFLALALQHEEEDQLADKRIGPNVREYISDLDQPMIVRAETRPQRS